MQKPTLPDPNEVNGSVMADPFNMDHIKVEEPDPSLGLECTPEFPYSGSCVVRLQEPVG